MSCIEPFVTEPYAIGFSDLFISAMKQRYAWQKQISPLGSLTPVGMKLKQGDHNLIIIKINP